MLGLHVPIQNFVFILTVQCILLVAEADSGVDHRNIWNLWYKSSLVGTAPCRKILITCASKKLGVLIIQ